MGVLMQLLLGTIGHQSELWSFPHYALPAYFKTTFQAPGYKQVFMNFEWALNERERSSIKQHFKLNFSRAQSKFNNLTLWNSGLLVTNYAE